MRRRTFFTALLLALTAAFSPLRAAGASEAFLQAEHLGGLRLGLAEKDVLKLLGQPEKKGGLVMQEADGNFVQQWEYPAKGLSIQMSAGGKKTGAKTIAAITASAPCALALCLSTRRQNTDDGCHREGGSVHGRLPSANGRASTSGP